VVRAVEVIGVVGEAVVEGQAVVGEAGLVGGVERKKFVGSRSIRRVKK
jgi:hypothetical protein